MQSKISIHPSLNQFHDIKKIAVGLALFHDTGYYPDFMGHYGQFENNAQAMASNINKMHIALYSQDMTLKTWQRRNGHNRTADNFVIYTEHFLHDRYFHILAVLSPEAYKRINSLLPNYITQAEQFHRLNKESLNALLYFTNTNEIERLFSVTP